jgi:C4-dicarboxylate-specific signal transduction histidine kinase
VIVSASYQAILQQQILTKTSAKDWSEIENLLRMTMKETGFSHGAVAIRSHDTLVMKVAIGFELMTSPFSGSFGEQTFGEASAHVIEGLASHSTFAMHPLVIGEPYIRTYMGCPIQLPNGCVGVYFVMNNSDVKPTELMAAGLIKSTKKVEVILSQAIKTESVLKARDENRSRDLTRLDGRDSETGHDEWEAVASRLKGRFWLAQIFCFLFIMAIAVLTYRLNASYTEIVDRNQYLRSVSVKNAQIFVELYEAETGQRGFLLTSDKHYLKPFEDATRSIFEKGLRFGDDDQNVEATATANHLNGLSYKKLGELHQTVSLFESKNRKMALEIVKSNVGHELMQEITLNYHKLQKLLEMQIEKNTNDAKELRLMAAVSVIFGGLLIGLISAASLVLNQKVLRIKEQVNKRLARNRRYMDSLISAMPDVYVVIDNKNLIVEVKAPLSMLAKGVTSVGTGISILEVGNEAFRSKCRQLLAELRLTGLDQVFTNEYDAHSGSVVVENRLIKLSDDEILLISRDITNTVRAVQTIADQNRRLSETSRLSEIGKMAGGMAHEINNPLSAIRLNNGNIRQMALEGELDPLEVLEAVEIIELTSGRISEVISSLRALSRQDAFAQMELVDLAEVVNRTFALSRERFKNHNVRLNFLKPEKRILCNCRSSEISQVLLNLLNNSFDAVVLKKNPWVQIEIGVRESETVWLSVTDSGYGLAGNIREKMFDLFFTTKPAGQGTGLGLHISRRLVEAHSGKLIFDEKSENTRFLVEWPLMELTGQSERTAA